MSKLFKKLIYLLLPFILLALFTEFNLRQVENGYSRKSQDIEAALESTEILVLGSSHSLFGVDPDQFSQKTFNMAYVSQSFYYDWMLLDIYIDRMPALKRVVLPISYFSLDWSMAKSTEKWRCFFYEKYFGFPVEGSSTQQFSAKFDLKRYSMIDLYGVQKSLKHLRNNFSLDLVKGQQTNGWLKKDLTLALFDEKGMKRVALHESLMSPEMRSINLAYLGKISDRLKRKGVELTLVTLPVHNTYSSHVDSDMLDSIIDTSSRFCIENNCEYLNFFSDDRFDNEDFFDSDHLNVTGAIKFSALLDMELLH